VTHVAFARAENGMLCRMRGVALLGSLAVALLASCGPIEYVNQVTRKASTEVSAARTAEADRYSPYHYTLAQEYLHKAREEAAAADFQAANRFGKRAQQAAAAAREEAVANAGKPIEQFYPGFNVKVDAEGKLTETDKGGGLAPLDTEAEDEDKK